MPTGRPSKYDPEFCSTVIEVGKEGGSLAEMADACGVIRETLREWCKIHEDFSDAVKIAEAKSQVWWEQQGRKATFGGTEGFSAVSYIFQMKNRFKEDWRDKQEAELYGKDGGPIVHRNANEMSDDELASIAAKAK